MKKLLLLITVFTAIHTAQAQTDLLMGSRNNIWDTINNTFIGTDSSTYEYDGQGRTLNRYNVRRNTATNIWDSIGKTSYYYNASTGLLEGLTYYSYNNASHVFIPTGRTIYLYDTDSLPSYTINSTYSGGTFVTTGRFEYYYNTLRLLTNKYYKPYNTSTNTFTNQSLSVYHYNTLKQNDTITDLIWNGSAWGNSKYTAMQYNTQGLVSGRTSYSWYGGTWQYGFRQTYTYYPDSLEQEGYFFQDIGGGIFKNVSRETYTYQAGKTKQDLYYLWDNANTVWYLWEQTDYGFDSNNMQITMDHLKMDTSTHTLTLRQHNIYEYDADGNYHHSITSDLVPYLGTLRNTGEYFGWYLLTANGLSNILPINEVKLYPNPANNELNINFSNESITPVSIYLYNTNGQALQNFSFETQGLTSATLNTSNLNSGVYILQFTNSNGQASYKFIVEH